MIYFIFTIDVEPDCSAGWDLSNPLRFHAVKTGVGEILHPFFKKHGLVPTYLINNIVLEDDESVGVFRGLEGRFELGVHLHPEFIEPDKTIFDYAGKYMKGDSCTYPAEIEAAKIRNLTSVFKERFGYQPVSFRAGRFAAGKNTFLALTELGYKVDTSVTPHIRWDDITHDKPIDHSHSPLYPYWINDKLLEVPVSIVKRRFFGKIIWLRPTLIDYRRLCRGFELLLKSQRGRDDIILT